MPPEYAIETLPADDLHAYFTALEEAFQQDPQEDEVALWSRLIEPARTFVARAGGTIVGGAAVLGMQLAVPGGQVVPMAGVTGVGIDPEHRRRGLLDRLMRAQLEAIRERGEEAVSALWASEAGIYGRWGYGQATRNAELSVRSPEATLLRAAPDRRPRAGAPADLLPELRAIYDAVLPGCPGMTGRGDVLWEDAIADFEHRREGATRLRALVTEGGYALYAIKEAHTEGRPESEIRLRELIAATPAARAILWEHLLALSLTRSVHWPLAAEDEPLPYMLTDSRAVSVRLGDGLFVRLVDLPRALAERAYSAPVDVVLDVADAVCPWNGGRWRLAGDADGATCERTDGPADLALGAAELGAAYLGGATLALLAAAGRVEERTPGALAAASGAFQGARAPWCPAVF